MTGALDRWGCVSDDVLSGDALMMVIHPLIDGSRRAQHDRLLVVGDCKMSALAHALCGNAPAFYSRSP